MGLAIALVVLAAPVVAWTAYLALLALLSGGRATARISGRPTTRFDVIVPAYDEAGGIAATVASLLAVDYPAELRRVVVVADNCSDATAERAREARAIVLERTDASRRGKGYALDYAFGKTLEEGCADAVVVVDADTRVSPNLLRAFDVRIAAGASAVQAEYGVANRDASWRTRLMHIAFTLFHDVRSRARERLGASAGLRGNGMAFAVAVLRAVPHDAYSVVEDVEYGIRLGLAGHRVAYAGEAKVYGEMVAGDEGARSQRRRWEGGRRALVSRHAGTLLRRGLAERSVLLLDLAADLLVPPLTYVALAAAAGSIVAASLVAIHAAPAWALAPWAFAVAALGAYVARGAWVSGVGPRAILDLLWAPVYVVWKVVLAVVPPPAKERGEWVRTMRRGEER